MTTRYSIDTAALLVEFNASVWTARKLDRTTTDEVVHTKNAASKDAARVNKHLLAGRTELDVITKHVNAVRMYVHTKTMPWSDNGLRLLPVLSFQEFNQRMAEEEDKYWELVKEFTTVYPNLITAQAMALGDMFKRDDYPDPNTIHHKFAFSVSYTPVPTAGDFRIDIGNDAQEALRKQLEELADKRVEAAINDVKQRLKEHMERISDRLVTDLVDGEAKSRRFHDTLVDGGIELCELVKELNVTGDKDLELARKGLEKALLGVTPDDLRKNVSIRNDVKGQVDDLLRKYQVGEMQ